MPQLIIKRADGGVSVSHITSTVEAEGAFNQWAQSAWGEWLPATWRVETNPTPSNDVGRTFRDAWEDEGTKVQVNMAKARIIHMDRIRAARDEKLKSLDLDYMLADEQNNQAEKDRIATQKQALRDLPATADLNQFAAPESLKAFWPPELSA
jgi:hypothetical protein